MKVVLTLSHGALSRARTAKLLQAPSTPLSRDEAFFADKGALVPKREHMFNCHVAKHALLVESPSAPVGERALNERVLVLDGGAAALAHRKLSHAEVLLQHLSASVIGLKSRQGKFLCFRKCSAYLDLVPLDGLLLVQDVLLDALEVLVEVVAVELYVVLVVEQALLLVLGFVG